MNQIPRCARCLLPVSLPSITLGKDGVCNVCAVYDAWLNGFRERESERRLVFEKLVGRAKRLHLPYDCLIPLSGGKDSTYALYLCSRIFGLKCLCITFDNGYLSDFGRQNIENALEATGADHIVYRVDRDLLLGLYKVFVKKSGNFCPVCNRGIEVSMRMAAKAFSVPLVVAGHGRKAHYLSDGLMSELQQGGDVRFVRNVLKGEPLETEAAPLLAYSDAYNTLDRIANAISTVLPSRPLKRAFWASHARTRNALSSLRLERTVTPRYVNYQDYIDVPYVVMRETLEKEMGWCAPADRFDHVDCLIEPVKVYIQTLKFPELSRDTVRNSGRVRSGQMSREEALEMEKERLDDGWVPEALERLLKDLGMTEDEFLVAVRDWRTMDSFRAERAFPEASSEAGHQTGNPHVARE